MDYLPPSNSNATSPKRPLLHEVIREQLEPFLARTRGQGTPVARFVEREIRAYLECGVLAHGFLRVHCDACGHDRLVAFSCKGRGFCPSCGGRRMADTAAWLVDRVLPVQDLHDRVLLSFSKKIGLRLLLLLEQEVEMSVESCRSEFGAGGELI